MAWLIFPEDILRIKKDNVSLSWNQIESIGISIVKKKGLRILKYVPAEKDIPELIGEANPDILCECGHQIFEYSGIKPYV